MVTTDLLTEHVDFRLEESAPERVGHKALGVSLSDLAAMGAEPVAAVIGLALPRSTAGELAVGLYRGLLPLAARYNISVAGGDTNTWEGPLVICVTAIGRTTERGPLTRHGGQIGDRLIVTGSFGGSISGRHLDVEPRVEEARYLHQHFPLQAAIDVSDGLALDASRLGAASGCGVVLDVDQIPIAEAAHQMVAAGKTNKTALECALGDGEDFELLLAARPEVADQLLKEQPVPIALTQVGELQSQLGLWGRRKDGELFELQPLGYEH